jgi:hypothetical protein
MRRSPVRRGPDRSPALCGGRGSDRRRGHAAATDLRRACLQVNASMLPMRLDASQREHAQRVAGV